MIGTFFSWLLSWILYLLGAVSLFQLVTYVVPIALLHLRKPVNLKTKYGCEWALVTGGSSGIGKAIVKYIAKQGVNVVVAAVDDDILKNSMTEFQKEFKNIKFRSVGVDLSDVSGAYVNKIVDATNDISVQAIFCNAGYIMTGCFRKFDVSAHVKNLECNATHGMRLSHHFLNRLATENKKGCIVFTSSPAGLIPNGMAVMYGSTKAFVTNFACSLATEAAAHSVDVSVFHPSPVVSRFLEGKTKLSAFDTAYLFALLPEQLPEEIFKTIGSLCISRDIGPFAVFTRGLSRVMDFNFFTLIMAAAGPWMGDYKKIVMSADQKPYEYKKNQ